MAQVKDGDKVKLHYTGKLEDDTVFDSSRDRQPFSFEVGKQKVIPGFEKGIVGMEVGQSKTITIKPEDAYGPKREELIFEVNKSAFPENIDPALGQQLQMEQPDGQPLNVMVADITDDKVKLDANHPLAGKTLVFDIELLEIA